MPPYPMQQDYHHPHQQMMDRTLSSDSSESLPYGYPQQPLWFNPVISRPDMSAFPPPQTMPPPPPGMDPYAPLALLPGQEEVTDEIIPTAIVIKNIPFSVPREQVMSIMVRFVFHRRRRDLPLWFFAGLAPARGAVRF
jgi:hypothetical protein